MKGIQIGEEEVEPHLFTETMMIFVKNPTILQKKKKKELPALTRVSSSVAEYKTNIQN